MAEFTMTEAALLQYRLALQNKYTLNQLAAMTAIQLYNLFDALASASDVEAVRAIRQYFPVVLQERATEASLIAAAFYDQSRELYGMTKGASKAVNQLYVAQPKLFLASDIPQQVISSRMDEIGYEFHQVFDLDKGMKDIRTNVVELAQRAPLDIAFEEIKWDMFEDDAADNGPPKQVARGDGCNFCKHMATFVGITEEWAGKFHKKCGCSPQPAWAYEVNYRPEWADAHEEAYYKHADEIRAKNDRLEMKTRQVTKTRVNSKGKTVNEKKIEKYYIDPSTGKEAKPESTSIRHIIATMPRK
jgi:hypothetical protein